MMVGRIGVKNHATGWRCPEICTRPGSKYRLKHIKSTSFRQKTRNLAQYEHDIFYKQLFKM